ncbi:MAG: zinc ribbon domain-containing protein [Ruminococcus sp.]|nr:zinc ribbon domain-containing protein [Ruminococcus sp.]
MNCQQCGAPLQPNQPFCTVCGAPQPAGAPQPMGAVPQPGQPMYAPPQPMSPQTIGLFKKLILGLMCYLSFTAFLPAVLSTFGSYYSIVSFFAICCKTKAFEGDGYGFVITSFVIALLATGAAMFFAVRLFLAHIKKAPLQDKTFALFGVIGGGVKILETLLSPISLLTKEGNSDFFIIALLAIVNILLAIGLLIISILVMTKSAPAAPVYGAPVQQPPYNNGYYQG